MQIYRFAFAKLTFAINNGVYKQRTRIKAKLQ